MYVIASNPIVQIFSRLLRNFAIVAYFPALLQDIFPGGRGKILFDDLAESEKNVVGARNCVAKFDTRHRARFPGFFFQVENFCSQAAFWAAQRQARGFSGKVRTKEKSRWGCNLTSCQHQHVNTFLLIFLHFHPPGKILEHATQLLYLSLHFSLTKFSPTRTRTRAKDAQNLLPTHSDFFTPPKKHD